MTDGRTNPPVIADNPFLDPARVRGDLYADGERLIRRSRSLKRAKIGGRDVPGVIVDLAQSHLSWDTTGAANSPAKHILDVGCGRGSSSLALSDAFPSAQVTMMDLSFGLLSAAHARLQAANRPATAVQADFHQLPLPRQCCDLIVAAFCLYHSTVPGTVIAEFARCLRGTSPGEHAVIIVTKSSDSYRQLDRLVAAAGLDKRATERASLYETAHSGNLAPLVASALTIQQVVHEQHTFRFDDLSHVAQYIATVPKYQLPTGLQADPDRIADVLHRRLPDQPMTATSTVTYVVATSTTTSGSDSGHLEGAQ